MENYEEFGSGRKVIGLLYRNLPGVTEGNHVNQDSRCPGFQQSNPGI
jgi:hypothetical protein